MKTQERKKIILVDVSEYVGRFELMRVFRYLADLEDGGVNFELYFFNNAIWEGSIDGLKTVRLDRVVDLQIVYDFLLEKNYFHAPDDSDEIEIISSGTFLTEGHYFQFLRLHFSGKTKIHLIFFNEFRGLIDRLFWLPSYFSKHELFENWVYLIDNFGGISNFYYLNYASKLEELRIDFTYIQKKHEDFIRGGNGVGSGNAFRRDRHHYSSNDITIFCDKMDGSEIEIPKIPKKTKPYLSTIFPTEVKKNEVNSGYVYLYEESFLSLVNEDKRNIREGRNQLYDELNQKINKVVIKKGDSVSIEVKSETFTIIHERIDFKWELNYNKFQVKFRSPTAIGKGEIFVSVKVNDLLVARMLISVSVENRVWDDEQLLANTSFFEQIFVSYARKDMAIIKNYTRRYKALGIKVFIDTDEIRSGQNWKQEIVKHLQKSDVFQLFWSNAARKSGYVRDEYEQALDLIKAGKKKNNYIRPNYWEVPMPAIPEKLSHINFHKLEHIPFLVKSRNTIKVAMNRVLVGLNLKKDPEKGGDLIA